MLDVIARMLISASILAGTTYLPALSEAVSARVPGPEVSGAPSQRCATRPIAVTGARALTCLG